LENLQWLAQIMSGHAEQHRVDILIVNSAAATSAGVLESFLVSCVHGAILHIPSKQPHLTCAAMKLEIGREDRE
jgi:hypothetical protein